MTEAELDVLLLEDDSDEARRVERMLREVGDRLHRVDVEAGGARVHHESRLSDGIERLSEADVDVVLLDLGLPDGDEFDALSTVDEEAPFVPIVVLTGERREQLGLEAIQHGAQDYLLKEEVNSDLLVRSVQLAIERTRQERERARRREQLQELNRLNEIGQDVTHAVITTSTREELERAVCERLVESDAYRFAWIGEVDRGSDQVVPRVRVGDGDGYPDAIEVTASEDDDATTPTGKAIRSREVKFAQNLQPESADEPWQEEALQRGYRSAVAIPIVYENLLHGVLGVYAGSPNAFTGPATEVLSRLGDVIGHAITAIQRKDALVTDTVLEFEFQVDGVLDDLVALSADGRCTFEFDYLVHSDDALIAYGLGEGVSEDELRDVADQAAAIDQLRILDSDPDEVEFELVVGAAKSLIHAIGTHGGQVASARIADEEFRFVVEFPPGRDKRQLVKLVDDHCVGAMPHSQQTVRRPDRNGSVSRSAVQSRSVLQNELTEKQRKALQTAYYCGFFDWPRQSTGEEVADRLGVTPSTFTQHLRAAERKFFDAVFEDR